jgi:hypothetical protein
MRSPVRRSAPFFSLWSSVFFFADLLGFFCLNGIVLAICSFLAVLADLFLLDGFAFPA